MSTARHCPCFGEYVGGSLIVVAFFDWDRHHRNEIALPVRSGRDSLFPNIGFQSICLASQLVRDEVVALPHHHAVPGQIECKRQRRHDGW